MLARRRRKQIPQAAIVWQAATPALALVLISAALSHLASSFDRPGVPARSSCLTPVKITGPGHRPCSIIITLWPFTASLMQAALLKFLPLPHGQAIVTPHFHLCFYRICSGVVRDAIHRMQLALRYG